MSAPTTVRSWLLSTNPSAHSAHPLLELSTVMTTGVSAPPIRGLHSLSSELNLRTFGTHRSR